MSDTLLGDRRALHLLSERSLLQHLNELLAPVESDMLRDATEPQMPVLIIVGAPRSGTTLLAQLLANTGAFGYVNNFVARFWQAPAVGALIERALGIASSDQQGNYESRFGVTSGWGGPHEFAYFWRRWFPAGITDELGERELDELDGTPLLKEVHVLERAYDRPLFFKNLRCTLHIPFLAKLSGQFHFIYVTRDPLYMAQSILLMRDAKVGDRNKWWSIKPKEYTKLRLLSPLEQVVGQVFYMQRTAEKALARLSPNRYIKTSYEELCLQPRQVVADIMRAISTKIDDAEWEACLEHLPARFEVRNDKRLPDDEFQQLQEMCDKYFGQEN